MGPGALAYLGWNREAVVWGRWSWCWGSGMMHRSRRPKPRLGKLTASGAHGPILFQAGERWGCREEGGSWG